MRKQRHMLMVDNFFAFRLVNLIVSVIDIVLALRFFFKLFGANASAQFVSWLYGVSSPLLFPFESIFQPVEMSPTGVIEWSILVAMLTYSLVGYLISELLAIFFAKPKVVVDNDPEVEVDDDYIEE